MPFTAKDWQDSPSTVSPITAAAIEDLEDRVTTYAEDVKTYYSFKQFSNVTFDGTTDVAPAINAALVSIRDADLGNGGILVLPAGDAYLSEPIVLQNLTGIRGQGMHSTNLTLANAVNDDVIKNYVSSNGTEANGFYCSIFDLFIDGNKANQTSGRGIDFASNPLYTAASGDSDFDAHHTISNVSIYNCKEDGFRQTGRSDTHLINVVTSYCDGYGFVPSFDTSLMGCTAGNSGLAGFYLGTSALRLDNCKAFYSGQITAASGHGFYFFGDVQANLTACEAQDNKAHGYYFNTTTRSCTLSACVADSNSTTSAGTYVGYAFNDAFGHRLSACTALDRFANGATTYQLGAVLLSGTSNNNSINVYHDDAGGATVTDAIKTTSNAVAGNRIEINNEGGYQTGTYAASYTPNPYNGSTIAMTLTGNITVNAPAAANYHIGSKLRFIFTQNAGAGHVVTWDAAYKVNWTPTTTANKVNSIDFEYNGTNWIQVASAVNL